MSWSITWANFAVSVCAADSGTMVPMEGGMSVSVRRFSTVSVWSLSHVITSAFIWIRGALGELMVMVR